MLLGCGKGFKGQRNLLCVLENEERFRDVMGANAGKGLFGDYKSYQ